MGHPRIVDTVFQPSSSADNIDDVPEVPPRQEMIPPAPGAAGAGAPPHATLGPQTSGPGTPEEQPGGSSTAGSYGPPPGGPPGQVPPPGYGSPWGSAWSGWPSPSTPPPSRYTSRLSFHNAVTAWIVAGVLGLAVVGLSLALVTQGSGPARVTTPIGGSSPRTGGSIPGGSGFAGPFGGSTSLNGTLGVAGTVTAVAASSFTVSDRAGQVVTVDERAATTYYSGRTAASSSVVTSGARVLVRGTRSGNTVTATSVIVRPAGGFGVGSSGAGPPA